MSNHWYTNEVCQRIRISILMQPKGLEQLTRTQILPTTSQQLGHSASAWTPQWQKGILTSLEEGHIIIGQFQLYEVFWLNCVLLKSRVNFCVAQITFLVPGKRESITKYFLNDWMVLTWSVSSCNVYSVILILFSEQKLNDLLRGYPTGQGA